MGWIRDTLSEVPLSAVLQQRVELADQKYEQKVAECEVYKKRIAELEEENAKLREKIGPESLGELQEDTLKVLLTLFKSSSGENSDMALSQHLQLELGVIQYHLDELRDRSLATSNSGNYMTGERYWRLTREGRRYVVETGLAS